MSDEVTTTSTASEWKKRAAHSVVCPSGAAIEMRVPDLPHMIESGQIPQHLLEAALGATSEEQKPSVELIKQEREFTDCIVMMSVTKPKITEADLTEIPYEDKEFIVQIATRRRDLDAVGNHIGGLHKVDAFRKFRDLDRLDTTMEGL